MAEHQYWIVAELAPDGDPAVVLDRGLNDKRPLDSGIDNERARDGQQVGDSVVLFGEYHSAPLSELREVSDHIDRLVWVGSVEGGGGATNSEYYDPFDETADPTDELRSTPGRMWHRDHFDYYRMRYGIHAAV